MNWKNLKFLLLDSCSPLMDYINSFHDHVMVVVLMIVTVVMYIFFYMIYSGMFSRFFLKSESLEILWTFLPCIVLAFLAVPSLYTLYMLEELVKPALTIKVMGHQWYWSYEYEDFEGLEFDSYMIPAEELSNGMFRLLSVDKHLVIPCNMEVRLIVSSLDVIHSWTVPSLGVKVDAVPGRLNQVSLFTNRVGLFFGQCSEICGALHSFMPICVESVPFEDFLAFVGSNTD